LKIETNKGMMMFQGADYDTVREYLREGIECDVIAYLTGVPLDIVLIMSIGVMDFADA
jgi:hypothetical protein